jgi:hypothetical protein
MVFLVLRNLQNEEAGFDSADFGSAQSAGGGAQSAVLVESILTAYTKGNKPSLPRMAKRPGATSLASGKMLYGE